MSLSPDSSNFAEQQQQQTSPAPDDGGGVAVDDSDASGRAFGRVRGQRLEITPADLTMYSMITGRAPSKEERKRALTWSDADPLNARIAGIAGTPVRPNGAALTLHRPWHPAALSLRLRDIWFNGLTIRMNRPQISSWLRRLSLALHQGRRRVRQAR